MMPNFEIMQASPVFFWLICFLSVTALAISKSGFGGALGSISTPILLFVMPPTMALGVLLPIFLITDVWVVYIWRKHVHWRFVFIMCGFGIAGQLAQAQSGSRAILSPVAVSAIHKRSRPMHSGSVDSTACGRVALACSYS